MIRKILKTLLLSTLMLLIRQINCNAQITDTALIKKLSINGICLCNTTLSSLKIINGDLKKLEVEEMDYPKNCFGNDSRYIAGEGYYNDRYPGMVFQKDQTTDQISKIRLTKQFSGKLPDGTFINMDGLLLKDILKMYPKLKNSWGSRGCSNYWNFSNDTLSFYVKIDTNKKPQFPIDEKYYYNKPIEAVDLLISCYGTEKHTDNIVIDTHPNDPVLFLDSVRVNRGVIEQYDPSEFASVTVYKGSNAINRIGPEGKNGVVYFETIESAKNRYWHYLGSKSADYLKIVPDVKNDASIQYILNKKVLEGNYESDLASIDDKTFKGITIITQEQLIKDYGIKNKKFGVVILSEIPKKSKQ